MLRALVPIADGSEEIEAVCVIDTLRRAGMEVVVAAVGESLQVTASRGVRLVADCLMAAVQPPFDAIILPGGMPGAEHLAASSRLREMLLAQERSGKLIGAICAAPAVVLLPLGLLEGRNATCHPAFFDRLDPARALAARVVHDQMVVTSRGPGTALEFALKIVELLCGSDKAREVSRPMLLDR